MANRHLDTKRLSIIITTISILLLFIALLTIPIIKNLEKSILDCIDNWPRLSPDSSPICHNNNLDLAYTIQGYSFWVGLLLSLAYWLGLPLAKKFYNYLFPEKEEI